MKKLLSVLATIGLTATAGTSVIACSNQKGTEALNPVGTSVNFSLKETKKGQPLTENDQNSLKTEMLKKLTEANNKAANVKDDIFTFHLDKVTSETKEVDVQVKATAAQDGKPGLKTGTVKVNLTINLGQKDIANLQETLSIELKETSENKELTYEDAQLVQDKIITELTNANKDATINSDDTFTVELKGVTAAHETQEISVGVKETQSTPDKFGLNPTEIMVKVKLKAFDKVKAVLEKIKEITSNPESLVFPTKDITREKVQNKIKEYLKEYESSLKFTEAIFTGIKATKENIIPGNLELKISLDGNPLINPDTQDENFQFIFINEEYKEYDQVNGVLNQLKEKGSTVNLSDFKVNLAGKEMSIGTLFQLFGTIIKNNELIPNKIPTVFDNSDKVWIQWTDSLAKIKAQLSSFVDIDEEMTITSDLNIGVDLNLTIQTKISDILNSILPDLIHFRQFMLDQRTVNGNENLLLLLIQYLFEKPDNINDDGFASVDTKVQDINSKEEKFITFDTNLERLFHDILEGWQNADGDWWHAKDEKNNDKETVSITATVFAFVKISIRYQTLNKDGIPDQYGLKDLLPVKNIKKFINQLLNYDLNTKTTLTIMLPEIFGMGGPTDIAIDLGYSIKNSLATILNADSSLTGQLDNLKFEWKKGILKVELLNETGKWIFAESFEDILSARDLRIKFVENIWVINYSDLNFELENVDLTINLDLKSSVIC